MEELGRELAQRAPGSSSAGAQGPLTSTRVQCSVPRTGRAVAILEAPARPAIFYDWYRDFIGTLLNAGRGAWFGHVIVFGEIAVGIAFIVGALTGIAAFVGIFMNMAFLLAGSVSSGPILFTMGIGLMLAWRVAGYCGLDRYLLPMLGTPWHARVRISHFHAPQSAPA